MNNWEDQVRKDYAGILKPEIIERTIQYWNKVLHSHNEKLIQRIEGMKKIDGVDDTYWGIWGEAYNKACDEIINHLKNDRE